LIEIIVALQFIFLLSLCPDIYMYSVMWNTVVVDLKIIKCRYKFVQIDVTNLNFPTYMNVKLNEKEAPLSFEAK